LAPSEIRGRWLPFAGLAALAAVYLVYWPHAEYVIDDWHHIRFYGQAEGGGLRAKLAVLDALALNQLYGGFQLFFLSQWVTCLLYWAFGYAPQLAFGLQVLMHTANSALWYVLLEKLGIESRVAWLAGAALLLIPSAHGPLFWPVNCAFFVWPVFWLLLYLLAFRSAVESKQLRQRRILAAAVLILMTLFAGSPALFLVAGAPLWMALTFIDRSKWKRAAALGVLGGVILAGAFTGYRAYVRSRRPPVPRPPAQRFETTYDYFRTNLKWTRIHLMNLNGAYDSYFYVTRGWRPAAAGLAVALAVAAVWGRLKPGAARGSTARAALFALGLLVLAYAPIALLTSKTLRHYYTLSPALALLLALPAARASRRLSRLYAMMVCGYFAACTVAEIEQCWIPQSQETQELKRGLAGLRTLEPGDWVIVPETTLTRGTAPYFGLGGPPWDGYFAQYVTGVPGLRFAREVVMEQGRLRFYHPHFMQDISSEQRDRLHVLAPDPGRRYRARRYLAYEREAGRFGLLPLKGSSLPPGAEALHTREGLRPWQRETYFPKPFDHGDPHQPRY
jgi:hypothetical protein